jgi:hypothetical protein
MCIFIKRVACYENSYACVEFSVFFMERALNSWIPYFLVSGWRPGNMDWRVTLDDIGNYNSLNVLLLEEAGCWQSAVFRNSHPKFRFYYAIYCGLNLLGWRGKVAINDYSDNNSRS